MMSLKSKNKSNKNKSNRSFGRKKKQVNSRKSKLNGGHLDSCTGALKVGQHVYYNPNINHHDNLNPKEGDDCIAEIVSDLNNGLYKIKCIDENSGNLGKNKIFKAKDTLFECYS